MSEITVRAWVIVSPPRGRLEPRISPRGVRTDHPDGAVSICEPFRIPVFRTRREALMWIKRTGERPRDVVRCTVTAKYDHPMLGSPSDG